jgi:hypothetical protein
VDLGRSRSPHICSAPGLSSRLVGPLVLLSTVDGGERVSAAIAADSADSAAVPITAQSVAHGYRAEARSSGTVCGACEATVVQAG